MGMAARSANKAGGESSDQKQQQQLALTGQKKIKNNQMDDDSVGKLYAKKKLWESFCPDELEEHKFKIFQVGTYTAGLGNAKLDGKGGTAGGADSQKGLSQSPALSGL